MPQPPSAASVRITQVRPACVGSPERFATISMASFTSCFWPSRLSAPGGSALATTEHFLAIWRGVLTQSTCESGCAVLAVVVATDSPDLLRHAAEVFRLWRGRLGELLEQGGLAKKDVRRFATVLIAAAEGTVVMSRAEQDIEPFETVARQLVEQARALAD